MFVCVLSAAYSSEQDFEDKEYNIKREGKEYWQLGRLGPDLETEELQAKREKAERVKQMAAQVRDVYLVCERNISTREVDNLPPDRFIYLYPRPECILHYNHN